MSIFAGGAREYITSSYLHGVWPVSKKMRSSIRDGSALSPPTRLHASARAGERPVHGRARSACVEVL